MYLFDSWKDEYHICGIDNLYMSDKFCKYTFDRNNKINLHGVTRKSSRGLPESVLQEEVSNKKYQEDVRGTIRAADLIGDKYCISLIRSISVW